MKTLPNYLRVTRDVPQSDRWLRSVIADHWHSNTGTDYWYQLLALTDVAGLSSLAVFSKEETKRRVKKLLAGKLRLASQEFAARLTDEDWGSWLATLHANAERLSEQILSGRADVSTLVDAAYFDRRVFFGYLGPKKQQALRVATRLAAVGEPWVQQTQFRLDDLDRDPIGKEILYRSGGGGEWWSLPINGWAWIDGKAVYASIIDAIAAMGEDEEAA
jgi:hypothetical protein